MALVAVMICVACKQTVTMSDVTVEKESAYDDAIIYKDGKLYNGYVQVSKGNSPIEKIEVENGKVVKLIKERANGYKMEEYKDGSRAYFNPNGERISKEEYNSNVIQ